MRRLKSVRECGTAIFCWFFHRSVPPCTLYIRKNNRLVLAAFRDSCRRIPGLRGQLHSPHPAKGVPSRAFSAVFPSLTTRLRSPVLPDGDSAYRIAGTGAKNPTGRDWPYPRRATGAVGNLSMALPSFDTVRGRGARICKPALQFVYSKLYRRHGLPRRRRDPVGRFRSCRGNETRKNIPGPRGSRPGSPMSCVRAPGHSSRADISDSSKCLWMTLYACATCTRGSAREVTLRPIVRRWASAATRATDCSGRCRRSIHAVGQVISSRNCARPWTRRVCRR